MAPDAHGPDRGELLVRMRFDEQRTSDHRTTWSAASRKGALRSMVSWPKYMLARVTGKLPGGGAAIIMQGTATPSGDSTLIRGKMSSQLLGTFYVNGAVTANGVFAQL